MMLADSVHSVRTADGVRLVLTELHPEPAHSPRSVETFLLIHGLAQNRSAFTAGAFPAQLLASGARVYCGELRGHGRSRQEASLAAFDWTLSQHLRHDLPALIDSTLALAGVDRLHLVGHSLGGILGYALLGGPVADRLASLITFGAPVGLGNQRALVRAAALVAHPLIELLKPSAIPLDLLLSAFSLVGLTPRARGAGRWLQTLTKLANPDLADPAQLRALLRGAERESRALFLELADLSRRGSDVIDGIDLIGAVRDFERPIAAVVGTHDIFAAPASVVPILAAPEAPRRIIELARAAHVDVLMGHRSAWVAGELWRFLGQGGATQA